jgi:antirestriction protein ArdC
MTETADVYTRVTNKILADLERGNLTWLQPWQAGHQAGPVSRPRRAGGKAYRGINVLKLWAAAMEKNYSCPLWLTYKQAAELGGQVRKGKKGSLVVYANEIVRTDTDDNGADVEIKIPFMKGYTVFNAEQIDGLPGHFYATVPPLIRSSGSMPPRRFSPIRTSPFSTAAIAPFTVSTATSCRCRNSRASAAAKRITPPSVMNVVTPRITQLD